MTVRGGIEAAPRDRDVVPVRFDTELGPVFGNVRVPPDPAALREIAQASGG